MPWGFGAVGAIAVANAAFNGLERPLPALALSLARTLAIGVPAAWLGGRLAGEAGTLLGILFTNLAVGAAAALWVLRATAPAAAATLRRHGKRRRAAMPHDGHDHSHDIPTDGWKHTGVRVIPGEQLDTNTPQTPGMNRAAAINRARVGAQKIWAGTVTSTPTPRPARTTTARWRA